MLRGGLCVSSTTRGKEAVQCALSKGTDRVWRFLITSPTSPHSETLLRCSWPSFPCSFIHSLILFFLSSSFIEKGALQAPYRGFVLATCRERGQEA